MKILSFKGRVIIPGNFTGKAIVTKQGFNTLASCQKSALSKRSKKIIVSDQNNKDIYKKDITDKILCLPETIGSTTGGMVIQTIASRNLAPKAFLFSKHIDPLAASGIILANTWNNVPIIAIDELGDEFLEKVQNDIEVTILEDGRVEFEEPQIKKKNDEEEKNKKSDTDDDNETDEDEDDDDLEEEN